MKLATIYIWKGIAKQKTVCDKAKLLYKAIIPGMNIIV